MFFNNAPGINWSYTVHERGKRPRPVGTGCYVLEHVSTGKLVIGVSANCSVDLDRVLAELREGRHPVKKFAKVCYPEWDVRVFEYPCNTLLQARTMAKLIGKTVEPQYLLLNEGK